MKTHTITRRQLIRRSIDEVFAFFSTPENLALITPKNMDFFFLTPLPVLMKEGALIDYSLKVAGKRIRWTTLITEYQPPFVFVDIQLKGPYSYWHHRHSFTEAGNGTIIEDEVRYALPFGIVGELCHQAFVKRQLQTIFDHRSEMIKKQFPDTERLTIDHERTTQ